MRILNWLGLMRVSEHERALSERFESLEGMIESKNQTIERLTAERDYVETRLNDCRSRHASVVSKLEPAEAKSKNLSADLAAEISERKRVQYDLAQARLEIASLRADAEAMRRKRQMDRNRRKGNG